MKTVPECVNGQRGLALMGSKVISDMGKRKNENWVHFEKQKDMERSHNWWFVKCKACIHAYQNMGMEGYGPAEAPVAFESRPEKMRNHLASCRHIAAIARRRLEEPEPDEGNESQRAPTVLPLRTDKEAISRPHLGPRSFISPPITAFLDRTLEPHEVKVFHNLLLELTVDANIPMAWVKRDTLVDFVRFLRPSAVPHIPDRRDLGGQILQEHADAAQVK